MDTSGNRFGKRLTIGILFLIGLVLFMPADSRAASLKIKMNGKTSNYRKTQSTVRYGTKKVLNKKFKGLTIKGTRMVPYVDVFKKGLKVKVKYKSSSKKLTMTKNGMKVTMTLGSKTAYVNGVKRKLPTAPVKVKYVKKKQTKILVPTKFLCDQFGFNYKASSSTITITDAMLLEYNDTIKKSSVIGKISYNDKENTLSSMPVIKLGSTVYIPAEETFKKIVGIEYSYDAGLETLTLKNEATRATVELQMNQNSCKVNGVTKTLSTPMYMIKRKDKNKNVLCVPAKTVCKYLGYSYEWNKTKSVVSIHDVVYFDWKAENAPAPDGITNYITEAKAVYNRDMNCISFTFKGSDAAIMSQASVVRDGQVVTVTIPAASQYCMDKFSFSKFVNILDKFEVVEDGSGNVVFQMTGLNSTDFAFSSQDGTLILNIMSQFTGKDALKIMKPSGLTITDVTNQDLYQSNTFKLFIRGNHIDFLNANPIVVSSDVISDVSYELGADGNTVITVKTTKLQGYKIYNKPDSFVVTVGNPREIYKNIVVLDAGHGGYDNGASHKGTKEKDLNFKIIYTLMKDYFSSNAPDTKVYWTRTSDVFITLANRAAFASKVGADLFISLHMNSASNSSANGTEVYYSPSNNSARFSGITSKSMATMFKNNLVSNLGMNNRGVKSAGFYVIKRNTVPAVLIELGFLSGSSDYSKLTSQTFQKNSAKVIYDTINQLFETYPTGR
ncbi:MAG: hypothetical protein HFG32_04015 [Eubacterium sp.]|jgi:N-acetylmuramoyl-L-alanine amidase|nr:hypothetical protein [Eubacterium sp.]